MIVRISRSVALGSVEAPRSKSWAIRLILLSAISDKETIICGIPDSDDADAALRMVEVLGSTVVKQGDCIRVIPNSRQCGGYVNVGGSGTVMRIGVALASSCRNPVVIDGDETLRRRPIRELLESLRKLGVNVDGNSLPAAINGPVKGNYVEIRGDLTSQYISGLMMLGLVSGITIHVIGDLVSRQYVELTRRIIEESGCSVGISNNLIKVNQCTPRISLSNVPGDYALSGFYAALALTTGGSVTVTGLPRPLGYGDDSLVNLFNDVGARSTFNNGNWSVGGREVLKGIMVDLKDSPDLAPVIASIAPFAVGDTVITGVRHLAFKESNRLVTISESLKAFGVNVNQGGDFLRISGSITHGALIKCPSDHRIAMMSSVIGAGSDGETIIHNAECVNKSNRLFWRDLRRLGVKVMVD
ncbi:3-phosphoshikimate 1-carboxyvinyltransferase [Caldivirga sp. UBA161]|uniref:3-phosphoshikimate 1-carboxyvinyltransferase n=1 Tax=Caldivirga sp. UBA161 TaxID=1915569 RepID=UPI0025C51F2D|nr:3-phosphoshikimate 1-carboxyvinyltransferase [Caldivirga sp. UBA161]